VIRTSDRGCYVSMVGRNVVVPFVFPTSVFRYVSQLCTFIFSVIWLMLYGGCLYIYYIYIYI
jgi:hypothetical protein